MKPTLLIAHPLESFRKNLGSLLSRDFEVLGTAADGREAIEKAVSLKPQLALFDGVLPKIGGIEAVKFLKDAGSSTCFVILTSLSTDSAVQEAWDAGVADYLIRPFEDERLIQALLRHVPKPVLRDAAL